VTAKTPPAQEVATLGDGKYAVQATTDLISIIQDVPTHLVSSERKDFWYVCSVSVICVLTTPRPGPVNDIMASVIEDSKETWASISITPASGHYVRCSFIRY
jgi:hypothetical protein